MLGDRCAGARPDPTMRNVFDQYVHPENRLTHALACCLAEDPALLASFLRWLGVVPPRGERLHVVEQRLPGEPEELIEGSEVLERRLPDAWIYTDSGWALLIESKIASPIDAAQRRGHLAMAERRGFSSAQLVMLSPLAPAGALPARCLHRRRTDLYRWACGERGIWAGHLAFYLPIAEQRMIDDGYRLEGALTVFTGIPFGTDHPHTYLEANRLLRLLMAELRLDASLDAVGINLMGARRPAITENVDGAWDFMPLTRFPSEAAFTRFPHVTVSLQRDRLIAQITLPNDLIGPIRRAALSSGYPAFKATVAACLDALAPLLASDPGATPVVIIQQRRYASQRSAPEYDALLEFDSRTAFDRREPVKLQEEWLHAAFEVFVAKQSNVQLAVGVQFSYARSTRVRDAGFVLAVAEAWTAMQPLRERLQAPGDSEASTARRLRRAAPGSSTTACRTGQRPAFKTSAAGGVEALLPRLASDLGATPIMVIQHRRDASQRGVPESDAYPKFDPTHRARPMRTGEAACRTRPNKRRPEIERARESFESEGVRMRSHLFAMALFVALPALAQEQKVTCDYKTMMSDAEIEACKAPPPAHKPDREIMKKVMEESEKLNAKSYSAAAQREQAAAEKATHPRAPVVGMTYEEVLQTSGFGWGKPKKINKTDSARGHDEQWVYVPGYVYFHNGIVTTVQSQ